VKLDQLLHKSSGQMLVFRANLHQDSEFHAGLRFNGCRITERAPPA
jgi:hypothetical protein